MEKGFGVGIHRLHPEENMNYCLNRIFAINGGNLEELRAIGQRIRSHEGWISEFKLLSERALAEGRLREGAAYVRAAQFFMSGDDPEKQRWYERYVELARLLHKDEFAGGTIEEARVPYQGAFLPVWHVGANRAKSGKSVVVMSLGFDSIKEELIPMLRRFREAGTELYLFEGPGMGEALFCYGLTMTPDWEGPVKAVLDRFGLEEVTLIGLSLGGYLAPRAAAFEPRVRRVVSWGVMYDFFDTVVSRRGPVLETLIRICLTMRLSPVMNAAARLLMRRDSFTRWGIEQGMLVFGAKSPYAFLAEAKKYSLKRIAPRHDQDFLLLDNAQDHFIPKGHFAKVSAILKVARSFTARIFTVEEKAANHVGFGNADLVLGYILRWIGEMEKEVAVDGLVE